MESLSDEAIAAFATSRFGGSDVERLPSGTCSQAFALTVGAEPLVLRIGGFLADYEMDWVASGWARPGLPVPEVLELGRALDCWFVLTRRVFGTPLDSLSEAGWGAALSSLVEMLVALQSVESPSGGAGPLASQSRPMGTTWLEWLLESAVDRRTLGSETGGTRCSPTAESWIATTPRWRSCSGRLGSALTFGRWCTRACPETHWWSTTRSPGSSTGATR